MWYMYYSAIKKSEIMPFAATWMDLEMITLSEFRKTNSVWYQSYVESNFENDINALIYKTETDFKNKFMVMKRKILGEGKN